MKALPKRRSWLASANLRDLEKLLGELDPFMRAEALDYQDELVDEGTFEAKLEERHFIREFIDACKDRVEN